MKKLIRRLVLLGALAGAVYAARSYMRGEPAATGTAQIVFDDGTPRSLDSKSAEGREVIDIARKIVEIGL